MEMILLNTEQANQVRGKYGKYSALEPVQVIEGFALPIDVIDNMEFLSVHNFLRNLPIQEVTFIQPPDLDEEYILK